MGSWEKEQIDQSKPSIDIKREDFRCTIMNNLLAFRQLLAENKLYVRQNLVIVIRSTVLKTLNNLQAKRNCNQKL